MIVRHSTGGTATLGKKLYEDIEEKAIRYGIQIAQSFVIVIWNLGVEGTSGEKAALYGTRAVRWTVDSKGNQIGPAESTVMPDGIFFLTEEEIPKYAHVSAVVTYAYTISTTEHSLRVYHNPHAKHPLDESVFNACPQFVPRNGEMVWIPQEPKDE